jgi:DNA polymerase III subunit delta
MPPTTAKNSVALIHGDDDFAVKQRARQIFDKWSAELGGMDHEIIDAQVSNAGEALKALSRLREALQTLPFFGSGKTVWLKDCSFLGEDRTAGVQAVTESLSELAAELKAFSWGSVRLLISAGKVDKRRTFYKTVEKLGTAESYESVSVDDKDWATTAQGWALRAVKERGKDISDDALAELVNSVGPSHRQIQNEVEKLSLYVGDRVQIETKDVCAIVTRNKHARAFALGDALGERDLPRLLRTLDEELWDLQFDREKSEIGLLYGLISKVRAMIFLKEMLREGWIRAGVDFSRFRAQLEQVPAERLPEDRRFNPLALNPYVLYKALPQARHYSTEELVAAMGVLLECNQRLIFSNLDAALVLQQALVQIVRGEGRSTPSAQR